MSKSGTTSVPWDGTARGGGRTPVTVIGLGLMGRALAGAFLKAGHPTTVWNRSAGKADQLLEGGARRAATVAEAVAASPVVVACVSTYDVVRELLDPVGHTLTGRVLVNLTTGTPEEASETAAWAAGHGADYLDGAIMAIPPQIGHPETLIFYSGAPAAFEAHRATLAVLGGGTVHLGPEPGLAALHDLALLSMMYSTYAGFLHALALVGTAGIKATSFLPYASGGLSGMASWMPDLAREVDEGDYATQISTLEVNRAGVAHIVRASRARGIAADTLAPMQALIERRIAEGRGADSLASVIEGLRRPAAVG